jgi:hypothetical protein
MVALTIIFVNHESKLFLPNSRSRLRGAKMRAVFDNLLRHTRGEPLLNVVPELADLSFPARG